MSTNKRFVVLTPTNNKIIIKFIENGDTLPILSDYQIRVLKSVLEESNTRAYVEKKIINEFMKQDFLAIYNEPLLFNVMVQARENLFSNLVN